MASVVVRGHQTVVVVDRAQSYSRVVPDALVVNNKCSPTAGV